MKASVSGMVRIAGLSLVALLATSCAKSNIAAVRNAEYRFPFRGKDQVEQQAYSVALSNQSSVAGQADAGVEPIRSCNGTPLPESWSSWQYNPLIGPSTLTESRSFWYKTKDGSVLGVNAWVVDGKKLFFTCQRLEPVVASAAVPGASR